MCKLNCKSSNSGKCTTCAHPYAAPPFCCDCLPPYIKVNGVCRCPDGHVDIDGTCKRKTYFLIKPVEPVYTSWLALIINLLSVKVSAKEIWSHVIHHLAARRVSKLLSVVNVCLTQLEMERVISNKMGNVKVS